MLNYNQVINSEINNNGVSVKEISPIMKLNLRGKTREFFMNVGKSLNIILPTEANTSSSSDKLTAIWLSPDEWMIVSNDIISEENNEYELYDILFNNISKKSLGAVTDVTDQLVLLELKGDKTYEIFSSSSPYNFNRFKEKKGSVTQTIMNNTDVIILNKADNITNMFVRRSYSQHMFDWINDISSRI